MKKIIALYVAVMGIMMLAPVGLWAANSAWCVANATACKADEPFNTNVYTWYGSSCYYNPGDTLVTDKEGQHESIARYPLCDTSAGGLAGTLTAHSAVNSGEAWTALPAGHSLSYILKLGDTANGNFISYRFVNGVSTKHRAMRFYRYYSTDHVWTSDPGYSACNSGKLMVFGTNGVQSAGPLIGNGNGESYNFYDVNTTLGYDHNIQANCCVKSPGDESAGAITRAAMRGKWWRVEFHMYNTVSTDGFVYWELWVKNVTDNTAEVKVMDSRVPYNTTTGGTPNSTYFWESPMTDGLTVASGANGIREWSIDMFRSNNGTACTGHIAHTSVTWASWDTIAGQRIGAATEVEGGGGSTPTRRFSPSINLRRANAANDLHLVTGTHQ